jgi:hypothetical protein
MHKLRPSPAMIVAVVALVMAMSGSAVAVVSFARNSGAVDGKSAVSAGVTNARAAGRLVATQRRGANRGKIPARYLNLPRTVLGNGAVSDFSQATDVVDNATGAATLLTNLNGFGSLTATCSDQSNTAGREDPRTTLTFTNGSGAPVNVARTLGGAADLRAVATGTTYPTVINGSNTVLLHLERAGTNVLVQIAVRQDGAGTASGSCLVVGTVLAVS